MATPADTLMTASPTWQAGENSLRLAPQHAPQGLVIHRLKCWMNDGSLSAGSTIPSERVLAEQFQVNRGTVRRALQILQDEGFLRTQNGRTRIVTAQQKAQRRAGALRNTVALVTPLFSDRSADAPHHGLREYIGRGTLEGIRKIGKHAMSLNPDCLAKSEVDELIQEQPYGVVITDIAHGSTPEVELATWFQEAGIVVSVYGDSPALAGFDRVTSDQEDGSYQLTKFLMERGAKRPLNFWSAVSTSYWNVQRNAGYERALKEAGLSPLAPVQIPTIPEPHGDRAVFDTGVRATAGYLIEHLLGPEPVDALLLSTDSDYFTVAAACRLCGKEPQRDILIVGYDNQWRDDLNQQFEPTTPIATIDKCNEAMGLELVRLLEDRVASTLPPEPQRRVVAPELCVT